MLQLGCILQGMSKMRTGQMPWRIFATSPCHTIVITQHTPPQLDPRDVSESCFVATVDKYRASVSCERDFISAYRLHVPSPSDCVDDADGLIAAFGITCRLMVSVTPCWKDMSHEGWAVTEGTTMGCICCASCRTQNTSHACHGSTCGTSRVSRIGWPPVIEQFSLRMPFEATQSKREESEEVAGDDRG